MAENSGIEWTTHTFNPWRGCVKVSAACKNCYAATRSKRFGEDFAGQRIVLSDAGWKDPIKWNREAEKSGVRPRVFCASLADVFEDWGGEMVDHKGQKLFVDRSGLWSEFDRVADAAPPRRSLAMSDVRRRLFELIDATPNLDWLILTKRPDNVRSMLPDYSYDACLSGDCPHDTQSECDESIPLNRKRDNVWLGTTVEDQGQADNRLDELNKVADLCRFRFVSCEPLLGPVLFRNVAMPDWVIAGGESGPNARPSHPDWFRSLRDQCEAAGVPFHFKQWGEWAPGSGNGFTQWPEIDKNRPLLMPSDLGSSKEDHHEIMIHIGKKKAGRLLDGVEHNGFPGVKNDN